MEKSKEFRKLVEIFVKDLQKSKIRAKIIKSRVYGRNRMRSRYFIVKYNNAIYTIRCSDHESSDINIDKYNKIFDLRYNSPTFLREFQEATIWILKKYSSNS